MDMPRAIAENFNLLAFRPAENFESQGCGLRLGDLGRLELLIRAHRQALRIQRHVPELVVEPGGLVAPLDDLLDPIKH